MFPGSHCIFPSGRPGSRSSGKRWCETADKAVWKQGGLLYYEEGLLICCKTRFLHSLANASFLCGIRVIGVASSINQHPKRTIRKEEKNPHISWISKKKCLPCLTIIQSCYFDYKMNKPLTCSRCVICVSCSVHWNSTYYVRTGSWAF